MATQAWPCMTSLKNGRWNKIEFPVSAKDGGTRYVAKDRQVWLATTKTAAIPRRPWVKITRVSDSFRVCGKLEIIAYICPATGTGKSCRTLGRQVGNCHFEQTGIIDGDTGQ